MNPADLYYIKQHEEVKGPYDLVTMGDLLLKKIISPDTMVRVEGSLDWQPFGKYRQYEVIKETSVDSAIREKNLEIQAEANVPFIPLPSKQTAITLAAKILFLLILGAVAYLCGWHDSVLGTIILFLGTAIAGIAQCLILGKVLNEDSLTIGKVSFVPLYDIYYFASNLDSYFTSFFMKYTGITLVLSAAAGMGKLHINFH